MTYFAKQSISETPDFRRIFELPRRKSPLENAGSLARELTEILKVSGFCPGDAQAPVKGLCPVCHEPRELREIQAQALYEIAKCAGAFGLIRVGGGKTLLSLLAPFVVGAKKPVLLIPASLREKTETARMKLAKHWRVARDLRLISYEELGREAAAHLLTFYKPDLIIADEAHRLKNKKAGVTRRVVRYMRENPGTKFVGMSGTMIKGGTIKAFAHILRWSHKENAPIPSHDGELEEWATALDEGVNLFTRPHPGVLLKLASQEDRETCDELTAARRGFHRRLVETPGVVSTAGDQVACSLYVRALKYTPSATTDRNFLTLRGDGTRDNPGWMTPDGWALSMAAEVWRVARELALGFHGVWDPRPPFDWLNARKEWAAFVREVLSRSRTLDTELQVANACARGELSDVEFKAWQAIKDSFRVNPKDVWHDTAALETCEKWIEQGPGIVWVEHVFFGDELERRTGVPYFREGGLDKRGNSIENVAEMIRMGKAKPAPVIASVAANSTGRNLQPWCRNLITSCPSGAATWEQLLGRTHRDGQQADQVEVDVLVACIEHVESWERARAEAQMTADTIGDSQKMLIADKLGFPDAFELTRYAGPRWTKRSGPKNDE